MTVALVMAALVIAYAAASLYVRKASQYLDASDAAWDRMYLAAREVIEDNDMPDKAAAFATAAVLCAGCGCLTRSYLSNEIRSVFWRSKRKVRELPEVMGAGQREAFARLVINAIYYDSLRAPFSGFVLRRVVSPWLAAVAEGEKPARKTNVAQMVVASRSAIAHRREGRKLLAFS